MDAAEILRRRSPGPLQTEFWTAVIRGYHRPRLVSVLRNWDEEITERLLFLIMHLGRDVYIDQDMIKIAAGEGLCVLIPLIIAASDVRLDDIAMSPSVREPQDEYSNDVLQCDPFFEVFDAVTKGITDFGVRGRLKSTLIMEDVAKAAASNECYESVELLGRIALGSINTDLIRDIMRLRSVCRAQTDYPLLTLKHLLEKGTPCDLPDASGRTPLSHVATPICQLSGGGTGYNIPDQAEIIRQLVQNGASLESRDHQYERTPLMWAIQAFQWATVDALVSLGAKLDASNAEIGIT